MVHIGAMVASYVVLFLEAVGLLRAGGGRRITPRPPRARHLTHFRRSKFFS